MTKLFALFLLLFPFISNAYTLSGELKKWHKLSFQFDGPLVCESDVPNPFLDFKCEVVFSAPSGGQVKVPGFYAADGNAAESSADCGSKWQVNFTPNETGDWTFTTSFLQGTNVAINDSVIGAPIFFDGTTDTFSIVATDKLNRDFRATGKIAYADAHYLRASETGKYFIKAGANSPENFLAYHEFDQTFDNGGIATPGLIDGLHQYAGHVPDWNADDPVWQGTKGKGIIGALNYLASEGMNALYFITYNVDGGDGEDVWMWTDPEERYRFDVSKLEQWEVVFSHMDSLGILMHLLTQEIENDNDLGGNEFLNDARKLYYRELVARFGHHLGLIWNLGEENSNPDSVRIANAHYIRNIDPYNSPIGIHTIDGEAETFFEGIFSDSIGLSNFEFASLQGNANQYNQWAEFLRNRSDSAGRKWMVFGDEQNPAIPLDSSDMDDIREGLWGNLLAGGGGVEWYFGYQDTFGDVQSEDWRIVDYLWNQTRYALNFFQEHLPFWEMEPANDLLSGFQNLCFAKEGEVYAGYFENGLSSSFSIPTAGAGTYEIKWLDPIKGGELQTGSVPVSNGCSGDISLGFPPYNSQQEWVVLVNKISGDSSVTITAPLDGSEFDEGESITLSVDVCGLPEYITHVSYFNDAGLIDSTSTFPYALQWENVPAGAYQIHAEVLLDSSTLFSDTVGISVIPVPTDDLEIIVSNPLNGTEFDYGAVVNLEAVVSGINSASSTSTYLNVINPEFGWRNLKIGYHPTNFWGNYYDVIASGNTYLEITLKDISGNTEWDELEIRPQGKSANAPIVSDYAQQPIGSDWTTIVIPLTDFPPSVDFADLSYIQFPHCDGTGPFEIGLQRIEFTGGTNPFVWFGDEKTDNSHTGDGDPGQMTAEMITDSNQAPTLEIEYVSFYEGLNEVGIDSTEPYSLDWLPSTSGTFDLSAKAVAADTIVTSTNPVFIAVLPEPGPEPSLSISNPIDGQSFLVPESVNITTTFVNPNDTIDKVSLLVNDVFQEMDTTDPFTFSWELLTEGRFELVVLGFDQANNLLVTDTISIFGTLPIAPEVAWMSPPDSSNFFVAADIILEVQANDTDGVIDRVEFYEQNVLIGTTTTPPYELLLSGLTVGGYTFYAIAFDDHGLSDTTDTVHVTVVEPPNVPPVISIISPLENSSVLLNGSVDIVASADDSDGEVTNVVFYLNDSLIGNDQFIPFEWSYLASDTGNMMLYAVAFDDDGDSTVSAPVNFVVTTDTTPPLLSIEIIDPSNNQQFGESSSFTIQTAIEGATTGQDTITYLRVMNPSFGWQNLKIGYHPTNFWGNYYDVIASGNDMLEITLKDISGGTEWDEIEIRPQGKSAQPLLVSDYLDVPITNEWATIVIPLVDFHSSIDFSDISYMQFPHCDGTSPFEIGIQRIEFTGGSQPFVWFGDEKTDNSHTGDGDPGQMIAEVVTEISVSSNPGVEIDRVEFYANNGLLGSDFNNPYTWPANNWLVGDYTISVLAVTTENGSFASSPVSISIVEAPNIPPTVSITSPADGSTYEFPSALNFNVDANDPDGTITDVSLFISNTFYQSILTEPYDFAWATIDTGVYQVYAVAQDEEGAFGISDTVSVEVYNLPPEPRVITITNPIDGSVFNEGESITISAEVDEAALGSSTYLHVINEGKSWKKLKLGYNSTNLWGPDYDVAAGGNNVMEITLRDFAGNAEWGDIEVRPGGDGNLELVDYVDPIAATQGWVTIAIPFSDFDSDVDFTGFSNIHLPYSDGAGEFEIGIQQVEFTGGSEPFLWFGDDHVDNVHDGNGGGGQLTASLVEGEGNEVDRVEFYDGATLINTVLASPYNFVWSGLALGSHELNALVVFEDNSTESAYPVTFDVLSNVNKRENDMTESQRELVIAINPNPVRNNLYLSTKEAEILDIDLIDLAGNQLFLLKDFNVNQNGSGANINLGELLGGLYFIRVLTSAGSKSLKVVKQ